ncbi:uncharacterized protein LOC131877951 isoform X2 [Tigriopus californicus]|uniref:uncharacterized protein LOC131877951 isoform X2 n=1 Tax=Tigriopus californicus TaxID=6832 RepID=UPI0027DA8CD2|nr:uncharacterized protein LOC131877951 isoform X2 [Tigriopus californicus]
MRPAYELDRDCSTSDQSPRPMSPVSQRVSRPYLNPRNSFSNSEDERNSPRPRSMMSSYSNGDPESSILVSKIPSRQQTKRVTITTRSEYGNYRESPLATSSYREDIPSPLPSTRPASAMESPTSLHTLGLGPEVHPNDLESNLRRLKPIQVISAYLELMDHVKRMERQADLREELLRRNQKQIEAKDKIIKERDMLVRKMERDLERIDEEPESVSLAPSDASTIGAVRCRFFSSGCPYRLPSMEFHEDRECKFRPTRCPSLTCPIKPPFAKLLEHVQDDHNGSKKGRDRICRNNSNQLVSSYVNIDKEPVFYKTTRMTWVANELICDSFHFFLECMRVPPDWHLWVYIIGSEKDAEKYQATIQLFREDEYGQVADLGYSAQRSYTGQVISIHRSKEEIAEFSLGFMVHDKQIRSLCGTISNAEEQLFGYEVSVYRK